MIEFLTQNPMYVVLSTAMIIWIGIALYVNRVDTSLRKLEKKAELK
ncbi:MAG: CcmD family protein [Ignavibacteria bacterium]|nr:CcmD family protein [Ignavibacteria bacterium]